MDTKLNPTSPIDVDFGHYIAARTQAQAAHLVGGVPDYAFSLDQKLLQELRAIGPLRAAAKALTSWVTPIQKQLFEMRGVAVGPNQYPEVYALGEECARRLGIGIPQIYIHFDPAPNGFTYATDDVNQMIVLTSGVVENMTHDELRAIIGHECGHIHNQHGVYHTAVVLMTNVLLRTIIMSMPGVWPFLSVGLTAFQWALNRWSRCSEVSCDRAGLICSGNLEVSQLALAKLTVGGGAVLKHINLEQYLQQVHTIQSSVVRLAELDMNHPLIPKRLEALRLFAECDVYHAWRPETLTPDMPVRSKRETDATCEQFISVLSSKYTRPEG